MGLLDRLLRRKPTSAADVTQRGKAPSTEPTVTMNHWAGAVERGPRQRPEGSFDDWVAAMEAKRATRKDSTTKVTIAEVDEESLRVLDLRGVALERHRIVGSSNYMTDRDRRLHSDTSYLLVREPENIHDGNAVAVYGRGRTSRR